MVEEKDIVFVTTTLYTKWLNYQKQIIKDLFPESQHIIVDGRGNWPNSWFYWIDEVKKCDQKYYVHIDEDFFITSKEEFLKVIEKMELDGSDLVGCSEGYHHYRGANPVAINTFLMFGRVEHIKKISTDLKKLIFNLTSFDGKSYYWVNDKLIRYDKSYGDDFNYPHKIQGESNFINEQEPYYAFIWTMKKMGCKFDYLYPHFGDRFKSTNPRLTENSEDIGIHMWFTRNWHETFDVHGLPNRVRYEEVEKMLLNNRKINIYINVAIVGNVNYVLADLVNSIIKSGLYSACNKIVLICNGDFNQISLNLNIPKIEVIKANTDISKCEFPTLEKIWNDCQQDDITVLYLHTKGVTKEGQQTIQDWTSYLSHFNITKWQDRVFELDTFDCSGVNLNGNKEDFNEPPLTWGYGKAPLHYSGNFWWSNSSHIKKLPNPINWLPDNNYQQWRVMAEMWLCQISDGKYNCAWASNVNHYVENYPKELYESN
jgi:hypothetical protein